MDYLVVEDEALVYISIGSFVRKSESCDQQIPRFLNEYYKSNNTKIKVLLFDPNFKNDLPLAIQLEKDDWIIRSNSKCER